ncbi:dehydrogenase [beta proteobacterium AAP121]|nr:dehydrogenase [beta proteobacterium AAP65]KPF95423.1 dehydrogenase [beta proteobacterium AAP121]
MAYMLLIVEPVGQRAQRTEAEGRALYAAMQRFGEQLAARNQLRAVESLASQEGAARVRAPLGAAVQVVDGPFAEAKEMIGGFFLLQNVNRAQAIALAAECPAAQWATVEVRALAPCFDGSAA